VVESVGSSTYDRPRARGTASTMARPGSTRACHAASDRRSDGGAPTASSSARSSRLSAADSASENATTSRVNSRLAPNPITAAAGSSSVRTGSRGANRAPALPVVGPGWAR
jgi:hypothetical protein